MTRRAKPCRIDGVLYKSRSAAARARSTSVMQAVHDARRGEIVDPDAGYRDAPPRTTIDNACTAAFRAVFGWCPVRDGMPGGALFHSSNGGMVRCHPGGISAPFPRAPISLDDELWP